MFPVFLCYYTPHIPTTPEGTFRMPTPTLTPTGRAWLKGFHILFTSIWVGAMICLLLLHLFAAPSTASQIHMVWRIFKHIDDWVIIPSAMGSLFTGLLISWWTAWGFFKWRWVTLKWIGTLAVIFAGSLMVGPRINRIEQLAATDSGAILHNPLLYSDSQVITIILVPQVFLLFLMIFISVIKPWKRKSQAKEQAERVSNMLL